MHFLACPVHSGVIKQHNLGYTNFKLFPLPHQEAFFLIPNIQTSQTSKPRKIFIRYPEFSHFIYCMRAMNE